ncbi:MAG: HupE/UreJ family protein [Verrucomicrobia bacterium]|nr:HupE/UreJ family protein [Verrucomicrobiota bacterium]
MNQPSAITVWTSLLSRHQFWVGAAFIVAVTWLLQELLDEHLHSASPGFGSGYLHFLRRLDHFLVFVTGGLLIAERGRLARTLFPFASAALVVFGWLIWEWSWPWATNSMLIPLFLVAALLGLGRLRALPLAIGLGSLAWLFLCHLDSNCEFGAASSTSPLFVGGLATCATLSSAMGVLLGDSLARNRAPRVRTITALLLLVATLALALN